MIFALELVVFMNRSERTDAAELYILFFYSKPRLFLIPPSCFVSFVVASNSILFLLFSPLCFEVNPSLSTHGALASVTQLPRIRVHGVLCQVIPQFTSPRRVALLVQGYAA